MFGLKSAESFLFCALCASLTFPFRASADAIAVAPGKLASQKNTMPKAGLPGGNCALAFTGVVQAAQNGQRECSDKTPIASTGMGPDFMSQGQAAAIGAQRKVQLGIAGPPPPETIEEALEFNVSMDDDKVGDALKSPGGVMTFGTSAADQVVIGNTSSSATQTVTTGKGGGVTGAAMAQANLKKGGTSLAIGFVHDPVTMELTDPSEDGDFTLGIDSGLTLQADSPGEFASAYFEADVGGDTLFAFQIEIDSTTTTFGAANVQCIAFGLDPTGCAAFGAYFDSTIAPELNAFDPVTHSLTSSGPITLADVSLAAGSAPVDVTFDYDALAGNSVPEPSYALFGLLAVAALLRRRT